LLKRVSLALLATLVLITTDARAFSFDDVAARAAKLASATYQKPSATLPKSIKALNYDQYRDIRFRPDRALWRNTKLPFEIMFFHPGWFYEDPVAIREVHAEREGMAYRRLHVRERIPEPLAGVALTRRAVGQGAHRLLGFDRSPGVVAGGFAFDLADGALYGREEAGRVVVVGAWGAAPEVLTGIARPHKLIIVDWCNTHMIRP